MKLVGLYSALVVAQVAAWAWALIAFHAHPALLGTAVLAYVLGLRHAFDADHIAAIDNVVRKLTPRPAETVGLWFALGHSTVVVLACLAIAATAASVGDRLAQIARIGQTIGTATSALFLVGVGVTNVFVLRSIWRNFVHVRNGGPMLAEAPRLVGRLTRIVSRSEHMYPLGFLFGLGFDTASEIGLLAISATGAAGGMSVWNVLVFPALFTAAMTIVDTTDSVLMVRAYAHAFVRPARKLWYNLTMTGASVAVALVIGSVEGLHLAAEQRGYAGAFWRTVERLNASLPSLGVVVVAVFLTSWLVSAMVYRWKRFDDAPAVTH